MLSLCATLTEAVFVYLRESGGGWVDSGRHKLSENIWFVLSKISYSGDMGGCHV